MIQANEFRRAVAGAAFWLFIFWQQRPRWESDEWIVQLLLLGPLVLVPLALWLYRHDDTARNECRMTARLWRFVELTQFPAALVLAVGFVRFVPGTIAGLLALPWFAVTIALAVVGVMTSWRRGFWPATTLCRDAALVYVVVGGWGATMDRFGVYPLDFVPVIILLTAVHFHYAAFVLPLTAGLAGRRVGGKLATATAFCVVAGAPLVALGINATQLGAPPQLETFAAYVMVAGGVLTAVLHVLLGFDGRRPAAARVLWLTSAAALTFSMVLAAMYASRFYADVGWLVIPKMAKLHGTANALLFALPAVIGWCVALRQEQADTSSLPKKK
ncbi:MAG: YndJ family transporter [Pirellulales bacterium]